MQVSEAQLCHKPVDPVTLESIAVMIQAAVAKLITCKINVARPPTAATSPNTRLILFIQVMEQFYFNSQWMDEPSRMIVLEKYFLFKPVFFYSFVSACPACIDLFIGFEILLFTWTFIGTTDARVACSFVFTRPFSTNECEILDFCL